MQISRSRVSLIYVALIVGLLALTGASSYLSSLNMEKQTDHVVHDAIPLSSAASDLLTDLINQETGIRGYMITADSKYLDPFEEGKAQLREDLETLRSFEEAYPSLKQIIENEAVPQIDRMQQHYNNQINRIQTGQTADARNRIDTGKQLMDQFRLIHTKLIAEIEKISEDAYAQTRQAGGLTRTIIAISGILALIIGVLSGFIFSRAHRAEAALRKSEETYRFMAESLEAQNEEIIAQQEEQQRTLEKLSSREAELEIITGFQEKLTGMTEMKSFMNHSLPGLLAALKMDCALVVIRNREHSGRFEIVHALGYPDELPPSIESELFGPARRVFDERQPIECIRNASAAERGFHLGITQALDRYYPLFDDEQNVIGFLLLTAYRTMTSSEQQERLSTGLIRQFELAFLAQMISEDRRQKALHLSELNDQLTLEKAYIAEQRDLIENILESTHEGMMLCDANGYVLFANHRMRDYYRLNEKLDHHLIDYLKRIENKTPSFAHACLAMEGLLNGSLDRLSERFTYVPEGEKQPRHAEVYASKVGDKETTGYLGVLFVFRDRTEEEKVDEMKNEFISIVSHELRTPLSSVLGFIEILLHRTLPPERQQKYLETVYKEANRLSTLINDFLDLQRMESGRQVYHFAPVELTSLLQEVIDQWQGKQSHDIVLHAAGREVWVRADVDRLRQVVHNLLSNAIKYSPAKDRVDIRLIDGEATVQLEIQDYGLGIPEEAKAKLFSKFYRVDNSDRRQIGGTGLGLAIVKEIVDAHGGKISFESEMGQGSTFTVELALHDVPSIEGSIVVLEDDDNLAKLIRLALARLGSPSVHLRSAEEGIIALQRARHNPPVLCIVDIHLEGVKTGWDFIAELYRDPKSHRTPVIVSTALDLPADYQEKDIEKYLKKPFSMDKLLRVARELLQDQSRLPAYIFPEQDEKHITSSLTKNGIEVEEVKHAEDTIEVKIKQKPPENAGHSAPDE
ncbi:ATP-binding protein [Paenibacillus hamazuiensis]|uniref:ATP-binding protein n=1 Tax=Paenibacillus hamazuiensis TaxID=2936508 RepID=UPI00200E4990|nr:ATP-binding protein [Paenibacillus hamazuiensis]